MAALTDAQRREVWAEFMRINDQPCCNKAELRAAVDALDQWIDDNAAAINTAIPAAARAKLTVAQKARLFALIALKRFGG